MGICKKSMNDKNVNDKTVNSSILWHICYRFINNKDNLVCNDVHIILVPTSITDFTEGFVFIDEARFHAVK